MLLPTIVLLAIVSMHLSGLDAKAVDDVAKSSSKKEIGSKATRDLAATSTTTTSKPATNVNDDDADDETLDERSSKEVPASSRGSGVYFDQDGYSEGYQGHGYRNRPRPTGALGLMRSSQPPSPPNYRYSHVGRKGRAFVRVEVEQPVVLSRTADDMVDNGYGTLHSPVYSYAPGYGPYSSSGSSSSNAYDQGAGGYYGYEQDQDSNVYGASYGQGPSTSNMVRRPPSSRYGRYEPSASSDYLPPPPPPPQLSSSGYGQGQSSSSGYHQPSSSYNLPPPPQSSFNGYGSAPPPSGGTYETSYTVLDDAPNGAQGNGYQGSGGTGSEYVIRGSGVRPQQQSSNYVQYASSGSGSNVDRPDTAPAPYANGDGYQGQGSNYGSTSDAAGQYESVAVNSNARPSASQTEYNGNRDAPSYEVGGQQTDQNQDDQPFVSVNQNFGAQHSGTSPIGTNQDATNSNNNNYSTATATASPSGSMTSGRSYNRNNNNYARDSRRNNMMPYTPPSPVALYPNAFLSSFIYHRRR